MPRAAAVIASAVLAVATAPLCAAVVRHFDPAALAGTAAAAAAATAAPADDHAAWQHKLDRLTKWAVARGANLSAVTLVWSAAYGSHVVVAAPVAAGASAVDIPWSLVIDAAVVTATPVIGALVAAMYADAAAMGAPDAGGAGTMPDDVARFVRNDASPRFLALVAWVHYQRYYAADGGGEWHAYLDALPAAYASLVTAATGADAELAAYLTDVAPSLANVRDQETNVVVAVLQAVVFRNPSLYGTRTDPRNDARWRAELLWAARVVFTRCFGAKVAGGSVALYPVLDLINHELPALPTQAVIDSETRTTLVRVGAPTHRAYAVGEQLMSAYQVASPSCCSFYMLTHYGFLTTRPEEACARAMLAISAANVTLPLDMLRHTLMVQARIRDNAATDTTADVVVQKGGGVPPLVLQFVRAVQLEFEDMSRLPAGWNVTQVGTLELEQRTVRQVKRMFTALIELRHKELATAVETGMLPADEAHYSPMAVNLVRVTLGAIDALESARDALDAYWMSLLEHDFAKTAGAT